jgi:serine/threonine-protein kinase HipA
MSTRCMICLGDLPNGLYHPACVRRLFGTTTVPDVDLDVAKLHTTALAMVGRVSLSGIQRKVSLGFATDRLTLQVATAQARYILKPQAGTFPNLPENEHVTMRLAQLWGLELPACGLVHLRDDSLAYVVRRFDRLDGGGKVRQEDFCQAAEMPPKDKYTGSAELCARLVRRFATEPLIELRKLYTLLLFGWWTGNGDLHLKNLAFLTDASAVVKLTPAYDLLNTRLVLPDDPLALPIDGKKENLRRETWLTFARYCGLPERAATRILRLPGQTLQVASDTLARSFLPAEMRDAYGALLASRAAALDSG